MSFGKLTLLSADCFGSGAMVGSSRMVADSSGTCGAPGGADFVGLPAAGAVVVGGVIARAAAGAVAVAGGWSAACVVRIAAPDDSSTRDVRMAINLRIVDPLLQWLAAGTSRYCT